MSSRGGGFEKLILQVNIRVVTGPLLVLIDHLVKVFAGVCLVVFNIVFTIVLVVIVVQVGICQHFRSYCFLGFILTDLLLFEFLVSFLPLLRLLLLALLHRNVFLFLRHTVILFDGEVLKFLALLLKVLGELPLLITGHLKLVLFALTLGLKLGDLLIHLLFSVLF